MSTCKPAPLGLTATLEYDDLGRRTDLQNSDGGEERYSYRFGAEGRPNLVLTALRRYAPAAR